jgi:hypothetical protein
MALTVHEVGASGWKISQGIMVGHGSLVLMQKGGSLLSLRAAARDEGAREGYGRAQSASHEQSKQGASPMRA